MFILYTVSFKLVFGQKKTFLVRMNVFLVVFWMPLVVVLMTLMTCLLALNLLFNRCGESVSKLLQSCKQHQHYQQSLWSYLCHINAIKSKEGAVAIEETSVSNYIIYCGKRIILIRILRQCNTKASYKHPEYRQYCQILHFLHNSMHAIVQPYTAQQSKQQTNT